MRRRHSSNAPGDWYIDTACTNCTAARSIAPGLIVERGGQSVFARQPETPDELMQAWRARLLCPTASVRTRSRADSPDGIFPEKMTKNVYRLGYNARSAAGAHTFAVLSLDGAVMIDGPRWTKKLVRQFEDWGGLKTIYLSHCDDVGDAGRYAEYFDASVWIHEADSFAAPFATNLFHGDEPFPLGENFLAIPIAGHSRGSVVYYYDRSCLFTGDTLAWDFEADDLMAWRRYCRNWPELTRSMSKLLDYPFQWVFAGHGGSRGLPAEEMRRRLSALIGRMEGS